MRAYRSLSVVVMLVSFLLATCSGKEAAPPPAPKVETAQPAPAVAPAQPQSQTAPAAAEPPKPEAKPAPAAIQRAVRAAEPTAAPPAQPAAKPHVVPPAVPAPPAAAPAPAKEPNAPEAQRPAAQNPPVPVPPVQAKQSPPAPQSRPAPTAAIILKSTLGGVRFEHTSHSESRKILCETCHHASRPEKPSTLPQQACRTCHASVAMPPMKTKLQAAFHNPTAATGTCIDCHKLGSAKGQAPPLKCMDCHKKDLK